MAVGKLLPAIEIDSRVLSIFPSIGESGSDTIDLQWYRWWLNQQLATLPAAVYPLLPESVQSSEPESSCITKVFVDIAEILEAQSEPSIDRIIEELVLNKSLNQILDEESLNASRGLVFAILGWQTMLFQPAFGNCPPQQFSVIDDFDGCQGQAFLAFKQDTSEAKRRLDEFLMGFGLLIPPRNTCISEDVEEKQAFNSIFTVEAGELNGFVLETIAHIQIRWTDCLAVHLEYHKASNTLYLFRYPSFCAANLPKLVKDSPVQGVIHKSVLQDFCNVTEHC